MSETNRATVEAMEGMMDHPHRVLDHGFIRVVDYMGDDSAIVQAARVSYGAGTKTVREDRSLIHYLMRQRHTTPFEMCEIKLHVKLPIFVARQWIRHRTASVNEASARYSILANEFYIPEADALGAQSTANRQGRGAGLPPVASYDTLDLIEESGTRAYETYEFLLNDKDSDAYRPGRVSLARELSRMVLPTNIYTEWYWKVDLHNLFHFLSLRADPHAQMEIRVYAEKICEIVKAWVPVAYGAFVDCRLESKTLSRQGVALIARMLRGETPAPLSVVSPREWAEIREAFGLEDSE